MRPTHCRKCWQQGSPFSRRCAHCGDIDRGRFRQGLAELSFYLAGAAGAIALTVWGAWNYL